jgi:hypothetical protein
MSFQTTESGGRIGPVSGPLAVTDTLMVTLASPGVAHNAAEQIASGRKARGALASLMEYVSWHKSSGAGLTPLYPDLAPPLKQGDPWPKKALAPDDPLSALGTIYVLHLPPGAKPRGLVRELRAEKGLVAHVHHPAIRYPLVSAPELTSNESEQWGLYRCGFPAIRSVLETGRSPGPIAMIDQGMDFGHPELRGRILHVGPTAGDPSDSTHAGAVAAIMAAIEDGTEDDTMAGCCSAEVHLFNPWSRDEKFDACAYYRALRCVAERPYPVLNLSMGSPMCDQVEECHLRACLAGGVVVVAAMGNTGDLIPEYPAAYRGVIAVGATTRGETRLVDSGQGCHLWISAPGTSIKSIDGGSEYGYKFTGSSFAAPFVSAAVWLALHKEPCLTLEQVRCLLSRAVDPSTVPHGEHSIDMGHGRLDMVRLADALKDRTPCPPRPPC